MRTFSHWLSERGVPKATIELLVTLSEAGGNFESPQRIMDSDRWFYFPNNKRFVLIASCPNGDGIGLDTVQKPGAVYFIDHERLHLDIAEISVCVADSLQEYVQHCLNDSNFPYDYHEAKHGPNSPLRP